MKTVAVLCLAVCVVLSFACTGACPGFCLQSMSAAIDVSCPTSTLMAAQLSGASCFPSFTTFSTDAGTTSSPFFCDTTTKPPLDGCDRLGFTSAKAGVCHVELTFANGFVFTDNVTFVTTPQACHCPDVPVPSPSTLVATCM